MRLRGPLAVAAASSLLVAGFVALVVAPVSPAGAATGTPILSSRVIGHSVVGL